MPLEFVLPLGFCPRVLVSKIFSAVRRVESDLHTKAGGSHKLPAADERGSRAAPSSSYAQAGGEGGGSAPVPRGRSTPTVSILNGWNSSVMPAWGAPA